MGWRTLQGLVLHPFGSRRWQSLWLCIDLIRRKEWWLSETVQCMSRCFDISSISPDSLVLWHEQCMSRLLWSNQWQHLIVTSDKEVSTNIWGWVYFIYTFIWWWVPCSMMMPNYACLMHLLIMIYLGRQWYIPRWKLQHWSGKIFVARDAIW